MSSQDDTAVLLCALHKALAALDREKQVIEWDLNRLAALLLLSKEMVSKLEELRQRKPDA